MAKRPNKSWQDFVPDLNNVIPDAGKDWTPNWDDITNAIPDKGDIADLVPDGEGLYDFLDDLNQWLPDIDAEDSVKRLVTRSRKAVRSFQFMAQRMVFP